MNAKTEPHRKRIIGTTASPFRSDRKSGQTERCISIRQLRQRLAGRSIESKFSFVMSDRQDLSFAAFSLIITLLTMPVAAQPTPCWSGSISSPTIWHASDSPISVCGAVTVQRGASLTIEPGVIVQFAQGAGLDVADGGLLLAEGTANARILFTRSPSALIWDNFHIAGSVGSPECRITYATFEFNGSTAIHSVGGTVLLDHLIFSQPQRAYISLDDSSFVVSDCYFPKGTAKFEPLHGTGGIKPEGHGIFIRNFFGGAIGYSDIIDFTGGNRPAPIVHFIDNVFAGSEDDGLDLDGTDAWVEGNIFLHVHRGPDTPDSASAVSGGNSGTNTSEITIVRNLFFDCDNAATAKQSNFFTLFNNTILHITRNGGLDFADGAVTVRDTTPDLTTFARGMYLEDNIIWDATNLVRNYDPAQTSVTLSNNILPVAWSGPGSGNLIADPLFKHIPTLPETFFTNWLDAQIFREWLALTFGSPAIGSGALGQDKGAIIASGIVVHHSTNQSGVHLFTFDINRKSGLPVSGWPSGSGYTDYRWRLDNGPWSAETSISSPLLLSNLAPGGHRLEVSGKRDSGLYQDDPLFGPAAVPTTLEFTTPTTTPDITDIRIENGKAKITFLAIANQRSVVEFKENLDLPNWSTLQTIPPQPASSPVTVEDPLSSSHRFFRVQAFPQD